MKEIVKHEQKMFVSLGSQLDAERFFQSSRNVQSEELSKPRDFIYYHVDSLKDASSLCRMFIKYYDLGSSSWTGGRVIDEESNFIAHISYNGRVWADENYPSEEIKL